MPASPSSPSSSAPRSETSDHFRGPIAIRSLFGGSGLLPLPQLIGVITWRGQREEGQGLLRFDVRGRGEAGEDPPQLPGELGDLLLLLLPLVHTLGLMLGLLLSPLLGLLLNRLARQSALVVKDWGDHPLCGKVDSPMRSLRPGEDKGQLDHCLRFKKVNKCVYVQ